MNIQIETGIVTPTSTGVENGIDVCFNLYIDFDRYIEVSGEVTLLPREDGRPGYAAWGAPDNWLDSGTLSRIRYLPPDEFSEVLNAIEAECAAAI